MPVALALDQSPTATGWAVASPEDAKPKWGVFKLDRWGDDEGERLAQFHDWLTGKIREHSVTHLFYESPIDPRGLSFVKSFDVTAKQSMQIGIILVVAHLFKIPVAQVPIDSWRSRFIGATKAPPGLKGEHARKELKRMALKACMLRNWYVDDDNAADALGILDFSLSTLSRQYAGGRDVIFRRAELKSDFGEKP